MHAMVVAERVDVCEFQVGGLQTFHNLYESDADATELFELQHKGAIADDPLRQKSFEK